MNKFTIDRSKWRRGEGQQDGAPMCDIMDDLDVNGQIALLCGYKLQDLETCAGPRELDDPSRMPQWMFERKEGFKYSDDGKRVRGPEVLHYSQDGFEIMSVNDDDLISNKEREAKLAEIFARNGCELEFIN